jgi:hypothetical protein
VRPGAEDANEADLLEQRSVGDDLPDDLAIPDDLVDEADALDQRRDATPEDHDH